MKLKFESYSGMSCLYVRGLVEAEQIKILLIGITSLLKGEDPVIIHLGNAQLAAPQLAQILSNLKKKVSTSPVKQYWVSPEKDVGDFKNIALLTQRIVHSKQRPIMLRISADDEIYLLGEKILQLQADIAKYGGSEENVLKIVMDNDILKTQREVLVKSLAWHNARLPLQHKMPSQMDLLKEATKGAVDELTKLAGGAVSL